jgi:hypothetical protein
MMTPITIAMRMPIAGGSLNFMVSPPWKSQFIAA